MSEQIAEHPAKVLRSFSDHGESKKGFMKTLLASLGVVILGILSGWYLSGNLSGAKKADTSYETSTEITKTADEAGVADESAFKESEAPIGILQEGGVNGEGQYHLERPGGASQNVYLTSTVIDLQSFVGKKVQVWGQTLSAQKAGWLMDVAKIKVVK